MKFSLLLCAWCILAPQTALRSQDAEGDPLPEGAAISPPPPEEAPIPKEGWRMLNTSPRKLPPGHPLLVHFPDALQTEPPPGPVASDGGNSAAAAPVAPLPFTSLSAYPRNGTEIADLAQSLRFDPVAACYYVKDQCEFTPYFGYLKGPALTYHDRSGNDCDLAVLLARLLEACPSASNVTICYGTIVVPNAELQQWLRVRTPKAAQDVLSLAGYLAINFGTETLVEHYWVSFDILGQSYEVSPSFRLHTWVPGKTEAEWEAAMGYDRAALLASSGGNDAGFKVTGINAANLKTHLDARLNALTNVLQTTDANKSVKEVLGHWARTDRNEHPVLSQTAPYSLADYEPNCTFVGEPPDSDTHGITINAAGLTPVRYRTTDLATRQLAFNYQTTVLPAESTTTFQLVSWTPFSPQGVTVPYLRIGSLWSWGKLAPYALAQPLHVLRNENNYSSSFSLDIGFRVTTYPIVPVPPSAGFYVNPWSLYIPRSSYLPYNLGFDPNNRSAGYYACSFEAKENRAGASWNSRGFGEATVTKGHLVETSYGRNVSTTLGNPRTFDCILVDSGVTGDPAWSVTGALISGSGFTLENPSPPDVLIGGKRSKQYVVTAAASSLGQQSGYIQINMTRDQIPYVLRLPFSCSVVANPVVRMSLDGTVLQAEGGGGQAPQNTSIKVTVDGPMTNGNSEHDYSVKKGGKYVLCMNYGGTGKFPQEIARQLKQMELAGTSMTSDTAVLKSLEALGARWMQQKGQWEEMLAARSQNRRMRFHTVGIAGQAEAYYVDIANSVGGMSDETLGFVENDYSRFIISSMPSSALEHGVIEQTQPGMMAASTCRMMEKGAAGTVYHLDSTNFATYRPQLLTGGYSSTLLNDLQVAVNQGGTIVLPSDGKMYADGTTGWRGYGITIFTPYRAPSSPGAGDEVRASLSMLISGGYSGGYASQNGTIPAKTTLDMRNRYVTDNHGSYHPQSPEPVDLATGNYLYDHSDFHIGGSVPMGVPLSRSYSSARTQIDNGMGFGWDHNWNCHINLSANADLMFGLRRPVDAAPALIAAHCLLDLGRSGTRNATYWVVTEIIANWFVDKIKKNAAVVNAAGKAMEFSNHTNGSGPFFPPPGNTSTLTAVNPGANQYTLQERHGLLYTFNDMGGSKPSLQYVTDPDGRQMTITYVSGSSASKVNTVSDCFSRSLTFSYSGNRITGVSDGTGRSVGYGYDASGNLTSHTDPDGNIFYFDYALTGDPTGQEGKHLMRRLRDATATHDIIAVQTYNSSGQVVAQRSYGDALKEWKFCVTDNWTAQIDPENNADYYYFDERKRQIGKRDQAGLLSKAVYDGNDHAIAATNPANETTYFDYDTNNQLENVRHPDGSESSQQYDNLFRPTVSIDRAGIKTELVYAGGNTLNRPDFKRLYKTNTTYDETTYVYYNTSSLNEKGMLKTVTDPANRVVTSKYDSTGNLWKTEQTVEIEVSGVMTPQLQTITNSFDSRGDLQQVTDRKGVVTKFTYNNRRQRLTTTTDFGTANAFTTTTAYDGNGNVTSTSDDAGYLERQTYSAQNKPLKSYRVNETTDLADDPYSEIKYDSRDWAVQAYSPLRRLTSTDYYANGWKSSVTDPVNRQAYFYYNDRGEVRTAVAGGYAVRTQTDIINRTITTSEPYAINDPLVEADPPAGTADMVKKLDPNGKPLEIENFQNHKSELQYSPKGQLRHLYSPLLKHTETRYNADGGVEKVIEPSAQETAFTYYTNSGLVKTQTDAEGTITHYYDANGNRTFVTDGTRTLRRTYDSLNRVDTVTDHRDYVVDYDYHPNGLLKKITYPKLTPQDTEVRAVTYDYYKNRSLKSVTDWKGRETSFQYNLDGQITLITRPNQTKRRMTYTAAGELETIREEYPDGRLINFYKFTYDGRGLVQKLYSAPKAGERMKNADGTFQPAMSSVADADNKLTTVNGTTITYDGDGNLLSAPTATGTSRSFTFDARNRLTSDSVATLHEYDVEGRRISVTEPAGKTEFILSTDLGLSQVLLEKRPEGQSRWYVYGGGLLLYEINAADEDNNTRYFHYDQIGSTVSITSSSASPESTVRVNYTPYGEVMPSTGPAPATRFLYAGAYGVQRDSSGIYHMRARFYDPYLARFLNPDPIGFEGGLNWFAYAGGNPLMQSDPSGLMPTYLPIPDGATPAQANAITQGFVNSATDPQGLALGVGIPVAALAAITAPQVYAAALANPGTVVTGAALLDQTGMIAAGGGAAALAWQRRPPGVQVAQVGDWFVKTVNPQSNALMQWWGRQSINAQYNGLQKLGDMAVDHFMDNGALYTRNVGQVLGNGSRFTNPTALNAYLEGSKRMGTIFNDIQPRNMGANGQIFDPAIDWVTKSLFYTAAGSAIGGAGYSIYNSACSR